MNIRALGFPAKTLRQSRQLFAIEFVIPANIDDWHIWESPKNPLEAVVLGGDITSENYAITID